MRHIVFLFFAALLLSSCWKKSKPVISTINRPWLRWASASAPSFAQHRGLISEGLTRTDVIEGESKISPGLAEHWKIEGDTLTLHLKPGVKWSDGVALQAQHVREAWKAELRQCRRHNEPSPLLAIRGGKQVCDGKLSSHEFGVSVFPRDPQELRIKVEDGTTPLALLWLLSHPATYPIRPAVNGTEASLGHFVVEKASPAVVRYVANSSYHGDPSPIGGIEIRIVPSARTRVHMFLDNETDFVESFPLELERTVLDHPGFVQQKTHESVALIFNTSRRPFHLKQVREDFAAALDLKELQQLTAVSFPFENVRNGNRISAEWSQKLRGESKATLLLAPLPEAEPLFLNLQAQWIRKLEVMVEAAESRTASLTMASLEEDPFTPAKWLQNFRAEQTHSLSHWSNSQFDAYLMKMDDTSEPSEWSGWMQKAKQLLEAEAVVVPLFRRSKSSLVRPGVTHIVYTPSKTYSFSETTIQ